MRFDPDRVVTLSDDWNFPRLSRTEGERRAADRIAEQLTAAGLCVERMRGSFHSESIALTLYWTLFFGAAPWLCLMNGWKPLGIALAGMLLVPLWLAGWWAEWPLWSSWRPRISPRVIGGVAPASTERPPVRLIVITHLDSARSLPSAIGALTPLALIGSLVLLGRSAWFWRRAVSHPHYMVVLLSTIWFLALVSLLCTGARSARVVRGDNRTGLALLVEFARTLPPRLGRRVELIFVAGSLAPSLIQPRNERLPTLLVRLSSPGVGDAIVLGGDRAVVAQAAEAATDLWIPHRLSWWSKINHVPSLRKFGISELTLSGRSDDSPIHTAVLAAHAQLVTELALRWSRQAKKPAPVS